MTLKDFINSEYINRPHFVLFGNPVEHSLSPLMHNTAARYYDLPVRYHAVLLKDDEKKLLEDFLTNDYLKGVNLTVPFKYEFLKYIDELDPVSKKIEAANALVIKESGLKGYNTDVYGFKAPLKTYVQQIESGNAVIFGTGGAAKAAAFALHNLGVNKIYAVSRRPEKVNPAVKKLVDQTVSYRTWGNLTNVKLYVNATPLGIAPNLDKSPVKDSEITDLENSVCYDLNYNPPQTVFLRQAQKAGAATINGLDMLIYQGSKLFKLWTGKSFPVSLIKNKLNEKLAR